jgi:hypothetical protein
MMNGKARLVVAALAAAILTAGCVVYDAPPGVYVVPQAVFDRAWFAAAGAFQDQGVEIAAEDRPNGVIRGRRGGIELAAQLRTQVDGSVQVQFHTSGATGQDPTLINRISASYDRRMGR